MAGIDYVDAGVRGQSRALGAVERALGPTLSLPGGATVLTRFGHYAGVLRLSDELAVAISTDGVGSKTVVAAALDRYDTIGFDCVAMNVNDLLCVGAIPLALVDYIAVNTLDERRVEALLAGLAAAAREAGIAIPAGEIAQLPEIVGSGGDERAFDLVGTCIGTLRPDDLLDGSALAPGDALIGMASSGIHANGLTLARRALLDHAGLDFSDELEGTQTTLGDELLVPTAVYVRPVLALWDAGVDVHGLAHVTGDGLANLCRLSSDVGFAIEELPARPRIFELIQAAGRIAEAEMFRVFNMGVGMVVCVAEAEAQRALECIAATGVSAQRIGRVTGEAGTIRIEPAGLAGGLSGGEAVLRSA